MPFVHSCPGRQVQFCPAGQVELQAPQLFTSVSSEVHAPLQQVSPPVQSVSVTQVATAPHRFASPPPPHVWPDGHVQIGRAHV